MKKGFVLGKFMPLHRGHLGLIDFASRHCDSLSVILCHTENELIPGTIREQWLREETKDDPRIEIISFLYNELELPNTSVSSRQVSKPWAQALKKIVPDASLFFSSELYGEYVAEYMQIQHIVYNEPRDRHPVSASQIREQPLEYWKYLASAAKPYFVKKIVLAGSESTGKSTLAEKLANHYQTAFVPEMARELIEKTGECRFEDLEKIAELHARTIHDKLDSAYKLLFIDTDVKITESYAGFLFNKNLAVEPWIAEANRADLYIFLDPDCNFVQDGTRLSEKERTELSEHHKATYLRAGITLKHVSGDWQKRFDKARQIVDEHFFHKKATAG